MNPIDTEELDRNDIVDTLAQYFTDAADISQLKALYYDDQYGYHDSLDNDELYSIYQAVTKQEQPCQTLET